MSRLPTFVNFLRQTTSVDRFRQSLVTHARALSAFNLFFRCSLQVNENQCLNMLVECKDRIPSFHNREVTDLATLQPPAGLEISRFLYQGGLLGRAFKDGERFPSIFAEVSYEVASLFSSRAKCTQKKKHKITGPPRICSLCQTVFPRKKKAHTAT